MTGAIPNNHLLWDGYSLENTGSGVYRHVCSLLEELNALEVLPKLFVNEHAASHFPNTPKHIIPQSSFFDKSKTFWTLKTYFELSKYIKNNPDKKLVYHGLSNINLPFIKPKNTRFILTVHDAIPFIEDSNVSLTYKIQFRYLFPRALEHSDAVVFVSKWSRDFVLERFPHIESKSLIIKNGFDSKLTRGLPSLNSKPNLQEKTKVLCVSRNETYKRLNLLLEVLKQARNEIEISLVSDRRAVLKFQHLAGPYIEKKQLKLYTHVNDQELGALYKNTDLVIHPSLYEGFCLPAVEALQFSKPIVYTKGSATDETVGQNCGVGVDRSENAEAWLEAIGSAMRLKSSKSFEAKVQEHIKSQPTWSDSAKKLKDLYTNI